MHGLAIYVKDGLPFAQELSIENSADSYLCFWLALIHSVSYFFFSSISHLLCRYSRFLILFHVTDDGLSINTSAVVFLFGDFNVYGKD